MLVKGAFVSLFIVCLGLSIGYMDMFWRLGRLEKVIYLVVQNFKKVENKSTTESE